MQDETRAAVSTWLTFALDDAFPGPVSSADLLALRDWIDAGCLMEMPEPQGTPVAGRAVHLSESMRVYWETKDWSAAKFRAALVEARLR